MYASLTVSLPLESAVGAQLSTHVQNQIHVELYDRTHRSDFGPCEPGPRGEAVGNSGIAVQYILAFSLHTN